MMVITTKESTLNARTIAVGAIAIIVVTPHGRPEALLSVCNGPCRPCHKQACLSFTPAPVPLPPITAPSLVVVIIVIALTAGIPVISTPRRGAFSV